MLPDVKCQSGHNNANNVKGPLCSFLEKKLGNVHLAPRELFEARDKVKQRETVFVPLRSVCSSSRENNLFIFFLNIQ